MAKQTVGEFLTKYIDASDKKYYQIAAELGYKRHNIITMFKQDKTKLPIQKIGPMARAINISPLKLFEVWMENEYPETFISLKKYMGEPITNNERAIINRIREVSRIEDPKLLPGKESVQVEGNKITLEFDAGKSQ